jgi:DMSO/TMAO reductase YedYZ heme-binding membrane subunit
MKFFNIAAWICGILAAVIVILGIIYALFGLNVLGIRHFINYFHVANSLFLMAILCLLAKKGCCEKKD